MGAACRVLRLVQPASSAVADADGRRGGSHAILAGAKCCGWTQRAQSQRDPDYDMMRPLPLAACLALVAALSVAAVVTAQEPATAEAATATATPTPASDAAPAAPVPLVGNAEAGRTLTYTCQGCHGVVGYKNAYPSFHVPRIGGQSAEYLAQALTEYKNGDRKHPTMQAQSQSFSEQDIADISAYLSTLK